MAQSIVDDIEIAQGEVVKDAADAVVVADNGARIKVIGVGGGGGNALQHMIDSGLQGVDFVCANTDLQALRKNTAPLKVQLGERLTKGRGAGANPEIGRDAALESVQSIRDAIGDSEMVFVTAGMGGGTGSGAASIVAQTAQELGALTVGVVTKPFTFEGTKRMRIAEAGLEELKQHVDCLITIPNDRLLGFAPKKASFLDMLQKANDVLFYAVKGISDVITCEGLINLDFADVRTTMAESGLALMGTGIASGENRAREAANKAIASPLLEDVSLESAKSVLYNITAPRDISAQEIAEIGEIIEAETPEDVNIIFGVVFDENIGDEIRLTVIATGIEPPLSQVAQPSGGGTVRPFQQQGGAHKLERSRGVRRQVTQTSLIQPQPATPEPPQQGRLLGAAESWVGGDPDIPPFVRKQQAMERKHGRHAPGEDTFVFDEDEFEIPTFIRTQAD